MTLIHESGRHIIAVPFLGAHWNFCLLLAQYYAMSKKNCSKSHLNFSGISGTLLFVLLNMVESLISNRWAEISCQLPGLTGYNAVPKQQ
jgi:hypothetical protein